jgi:hypothetical protein
LIRGKKIDKENEAVANGYILPLSRGIVAPNDTMLAISRDSYTTNENSLPLSCDILGHMIKTFDSYQMTVLRPVLHQIVLYWLRPLLQSSVCKQVDRERVRERERDRQTERERERERDVCPTFKCYILVSSFHIVICHANVGLHMDNIQILLFGHLETE